MRCTDSHIAMKTFSSVSTATKRVGLLLAVSLGLFCGVESAARFARGHGAPANPRRVLLGASWAVGYESIADLKRDAALVVLGSIVGAVRTEQHASGLPFTDFAFRVERVLADSRGRGDITSVSIHQTGGEVRGSLYEVEDDALFKEGERAVLFLREYHPGMYRVIGGPTGRFRSEKGRVTPTTLTGAPPAAFLSEEQFISMVEKTQAAVGDTSKPGSFKE